METTRRSDPAPHQGPPPEFSRSAVEEINRLKLRYPTNRAVILPALHIAQREFGWISDEVMALVADVVGVPPMDVFRCVGFYTMYHRRPPGKYDVQVCTNISCCLGGARKVLRKVEEKLGIKSGGKTTDGMFSLQEVECLASCGTAPVVRVNDDFIEDLTPDGIEELLEDLANGGELREKQGIHLRGQGAEPVVSKDLMSEGIRGLEGYRKLGGYQQAERAIKTMQPPDVIELVKKSGLRGRGGAGFPAGMKWGFIPKESAKPKYLCVNADEGEPGTFKDREILERTPHRMLEGIVICCWAVGIHTAYIYIRGEFAKGAVSVQKALDEAYRANLLGRNILGTGFNLEVTLHQGAGAYICGEETGLIESLEGKPGQPRIKPPFPAIVGAFGGPTVVNNVETLAFLPAILEKGPEWFVGLGSPKNSGTRIFCVSGHVARPGLYELGMGVPLRTLIYEHCGGMKNANKFKACFPGGSSSPVLTEADLDVRMDFDSLAAAGSMAGSGGVIVVDESACMVCVAERVAGFYHHESCGQCTPCREGTGWLEKILHRFEERTAHKEDLELLVNAAEGMMGRTICVLADAAAMPVLSIVKKFRKEFEEHLSPGKCEGWGD
ncbi:MAG: NADH-quinone oxidoreductase subunit NuoF [Candidatus Wallbacteria bacterium]|nr:NADH-quinone oxidoreductase subunit NuoF [Candidatus Wallbacteria bacterium]